MSQLNEYEAIKSVTFSDSRKKPRYEPGHCAGTSISPEDPADGSVILKRDPPSPLVESSTILEKAAPALQITKCITDSTVSACQGAKISSGFFREAENVTRNTTLCSDYLSSGKMDAVHHHRVGDISSADTCLGVITKMQRDGVNDLLFSDCPNIADLGCFDKIFRNLGSTFAEGNTVIKDDMSWFSSSSHGFHGVEDTLQSVILSSGSDLSALNSTSDSNGLCTNILSATDPSTSSHKMPTSAGCGSFPLYSDAERKGKSILSELAYNDIRMADKSSTLEEIVYGIHCSDPSMINMTLEEHFTSKQKEINPTLGSTIQISSGGCGLIQNVQDQEFLSSVLSAQQPSLQVFPKQDFFPVPFTSTCLHSYNPQAQMSGILTLQNVQPVQTVLKTSLIESNSLPRCVTSNHPSSYNPQSTGMLPGPLSMPSTMSLEKNENLYACQQFPAPLAINKTPTEHATTTKSSVRRAFKFHDEVGGDKGLVHTNLCLPAVNIGSSTSQDNSYMTTTISDDVSPKAAIFQQLQMVMDQLGTRTTLCIRDSLYRLARSAEQRHNNDSANDVSCGSSLLRELQVGKEPRRYSYPWSPDNTKILGNKLPLDFVRVSTSTIAIERAVSFLLFHKSLESGT